MTMTWIAGATGAGGPVFFNNIPSTFSHLQFRLSVRSLASGPSSLYVQGGPSSHALIGDGSTASSMTVMGVPYQFIPSAMPGSAAATGMFASWVIDVLDYASASKFKTFRFLGGWDANGSGRATLASGYADNLNPLTSIFFDTEGGLHTGSRLDLYGVTTSSVTGA